MRIQASLTTTHVLAVLADALADALPRQIIDPAHPDHGALVADESGLPDASHGASVPLIVACAQLALAHTRGYAPAGVDVAALLERATLAADFIVRDQRPSGLIDLISTNYDSSPDTGFAVQALCTVLELAQPQRNHAAWAGLLQRLENFVRRAVGGIIADGGFHTPNHRWVIASALAQAGALLPDLPVAATRDAYLAEGFDIDSEGMFLERSVGVYDAVTNRSLLLLAATCHAPGAIEAAGRNLLLNLQLLHADGTAETGLSRRQDYGLRRVPLGLAACYLQYAMQTGDPACLAAAHMLWHTADRPQLGELIWLAYQMLRDGDPPAVPPALPDNFTLLLPHNGIWRIRRGALSAAAFRDTSRLLTFCYGSAELSSIKISQTYFGVGRFVAETLETIEGGVRLHSAGRTNPRRPAYELPLGRPVAPHAWDTTMAERGLRPVPACESELLVCEVPGGLDLHYRTLAGLDRVTAQVALDFPPGGIWETDDTCVQPHAGQIFFLRRGYGVMRYGHHAIRVGPGADAHRTWNMRHAEDAPDHVRVLLTFRTPIEHVIELRGVGRHSTA
ncbi:MAG TPA: hypothetical protein PKA05_09655 [Roseiflexaceae bacterium]|nr:hypothetical protein [Roseiflexaceae bacterium]